MMKEGSAEATIRDIKRKTRRKYNTEEKIRIVIGGLRGEQSIAELCRREGIAESLYCCPIDSGDVQLFVSRTRYPCGDLLCRLTSLLEQVNPNDLTYQLKEW